MLLNITPRLRRFNVVVNSFSGCISDTSKKFSRTPEMSFSKMSPEPGMFLHEHPRRKSLKQLKSHANTHCRGHLNKQVDMVNSDVEFINFEPFSVSHLPQEKFTIHFEPIKLKGISCIFNFPDKMESILSEAVLPRFQIHFSSPEHSPNYVHRFISGGLVSSPSHINNLKELNLWGTAIPHCA